MLALALGGTYIFSLIPHYVSQHRSLTAIGQKKAYSHSKFYARDTRNRDREKSLGQTHLFNIWTIGALDRTSGLPQVKLNLLHSVSFYRLYCTLNAIRKENVPHKGGRDQGYAWLVVTEKSPIHDYLHQSAVGSRGSGGFLLLSLCMCDIGANFLCTHLIVHTNHPPFK